MADEGWLSRGALVVWALVLCKVALHLFAIDNYGYFRDELYYIACSDHLAWGYVDHPPLSIAVLAVTRALLGDSLWAIRLPAVLAGGLATWLTAVLARDLGAGRFGQALAALAFLFTPILLGLSTFFSMNAFELVFWLALALVVVRVVRHDDARLWLVFGLVAGVGMENKISVGFLVFGIVVGLALTAQRRQLFTPWFWLGGALAVLLFLPYVVWQVRNGFPTLEFMRNATAMKIQAMAPSAYLGAQAIYTFPVLIIWMAGLLYLLFAAAAGAVRLLGVAYLAVLALLIVQHGKAYYLAPAYPILLAAGGAAWEKWTVRRGGVWLRAALVASVVVLGAVAAPLAVPLLPPETLARYSTAIGIEVPREERHRRVQLSQHFADRFGWQNLVATVARVYHQLPADDQKRVAIFTANYGEAGAIDFFGRRHGLPKAISGHNNYWLWGPGEATGEVVIVVGISRDQLEPLFASVEQADVVVSDYAMPYETNLPVFVCRGLRRPLREVWGALKRYV